MLREEGLHLLVRGLDLVGLWPVALGHKRVAMRVVLEARTDHHHAQGTRQHTVHLTGDLVSTKQCLVVSTQESGEGLREPSHDKVVETHKEGARTNDRSAQDDHMALDKEGQHNTDDHEGDDKDSATSARRDDTGGGPGEDEHGEVETGNTTNGSKAEAPETEGEGTAYQTNSAGHTDVDPLSVRTIATRGLEVLESDPGKSG